MDNKIKLLFILFIVVFGCKEFKGEKIEINYEDGYVKILSTDYVIDSISVSNHVDNYYIIGLSDKSKGENIVYFEKNNSNYTIFLDSLHHYCSKQPKVHSPRLNVFIRKRGFLKRVNNEDFTAIEYFNYNKIPCTVKIIDTIEATNPYK